MDSVKLELDRQLTCAICLEIYCNPKALPCMHSFCKECVKQLVDNVQLQLKCPECREIHNLPSSGIEGFHNNYSLLGVLDLRSQMSGNKWLTYSRPISIKI